MSVYPSPARQLTPAASAHLDMLRGLAAIAVMASHWRNFLFVDWPDLAHKSAALSALYFLTGFGHQAVIVFFVLSGYLVGGSVLRAMRSHTWSWQRYGVDRMARLWIVLLPALLLCLAWDEIGVRVLHGDWLYNGSSQIAEMQVPVQHSLAMFFGNVAFLQTIRAPVFGSDFPLWSLANEFWYYVLFPLVCLSYFARRTAAKIASAILLVAIAWFLRGGVVWAFAIWLMGVALYVAVPRARLSHRTTWAGLGVAIPALLTFLAVERVRHVELNASDYILGALFTAMLYFVIHGQTSAGNTYTKASAFVAKSSYTLYLVHFPFFASVEAAAGRRWQPDLLHEGIAAAVLAVCYLYAHGVASLFESRTAGFKRWLLPRLGIS